eukprot:1950940-Amphidinium_carterae.1
MDAAVSVAGAPNMYFTLSLKNNLRMSLGRTLREFIPQEGETLGFRPLERAVVEIDGLPSTASRVAVGVRVVEGISVERL